MFLIINHYVMNDLRITTLNMWRVALNYPATGTAWIVVLALFSGACQDDESVEPPPSTLFEFLAQGTWELERGSLLFSDGEEVDVVLDSCDIDTWRFAEGLLFIYAHYREGVPPEAACDKPYYRALQNYQLEDGTLRLEGPNQDFVHDWEDEGFLVSSLRITPVEEKIRVTYTIREKDKVPASSAEVIKTFFLSSRDADDVE